MGISATDELLAAELFSKPKPNRITPKKIAIVHVPIFLNECLLFLLSWLALNLMQEEVGALNIQGDSFSKRSPCILTRQNQNPV